MKKEKQTIKIQQRFIPELVSGSSTHVVSYFLYRQKVTKISPPELTKCTLKRGVLQLAMLKHIKRLFRFKGILTTRQGGTNSNALFRPSSPRRAGMRGIGAARGFTLIELLVVVLIIAILSAIALPQYQLAVAKSRYLQAKLLAKALANAEERYYLEHGEYTHEIGKLDIVLSQNPHKSTPAQRGNMYYYFDSFQCNLIDETLDNEPRIGCAIQLVKGKEQSNIFFSMKMKNQKKPQNLQPDSCSAYPTNVSGNKLCMAETGKKNKSRDGSDQYGNKTNVYQY